MSVSEHNLDKQWCLQTELHNFLSLHLYIDGNDHGVVAPDTLFPFIKYNK